MPFSFTYGDAMAKIKAEETDEEKAKDVAKSHAEAEEKQLDETIPGGRYIVDGKTVDANGNEIKK